MNFSKPIVSDEMVLRVLMTDFSELTLQVQAFLILIGVALVALVIPRVIDCIDYILCGFEKRQELRANRKWFGGKK